MRVKKTSRSDLSVSVEERASLHNMDLERLGERLKRARLAKKLSQRELCAGLFTSAYVSAIEAGKARPTFENLHHLSERLGKSTDFFLRPPSGLASDLDPEQAHLLQGRVALFTAQTALEMAADEQALKALEQVAVHLTRLTNLEKAHYYYLQAKYSNMQHDPLRALTALQQAPRYLPPKAEFELHSLIEHEWGNALYQQHRPRPALTHYLTALQHRNSAEVGAVVEFSTSLGWMILLNIAKCYLALNDLEQALAAYQQALEEATTASSVGAYYETAQACYAQAISYSEAGDFQRACLSLGRTRQSYEQALHQRLAVDTHNALAELQARLGHYEEAEAQAKAALRLVELAPLPLRSEPCEEIKALVTLATTGRYQYKLEQAAGYIEQALTLKEACHNGKLLGRVYLISAEIQAELGHKGAAEHYFEQALAVVEVETAEQAAPQLAEIYHSYGQRLREWGEVERAFEYLEKAYQQREQEHTEVEANQATS